MEFLLLIGGIILLFVVINLSNRVGILEEKIRAGILAKPQTAKQTTKKEEEEVTYPTYVQEAKQQTESMEYEQTYGEKFFDWVKDDWLLKLGALLLLIGFGWLVSYAFLNNWIGPMDRIFIGLLAGLIFLAFGSFRIKKYLHQGGVFLVLGSTTILLTLFAAREIYEFFTPLIALSGMFLSTAFVAFISVQYKNRSLSLFSLVLAGIAPLLTNSPTPDFIGLFSYLIVAVLGTIWVVYMTGRRELTTMALVITALYSLPNLVSKTTDTYTMLSFIFALAAIFFVTNLIGMVRAKNKASGLDLLTAAGLGLLILFWIMAIAPEEAKSSIIGIWMLVFILGGFLSYKFTKNREPLLVYTGVAIVLLAAATAIELKGETLTIAYTIETVFISIVAYLLSKDVNISQPYSILLTIPVALSLNNIMSPEWATSVFNKDFFVLLIIGMALFSLGLFYYPLVKKHPGTDQKNLNSILLNAGSAYAYILLWLSLNSGIENKNTAVMIALVIYTIVGLITKFYGQMKKSKGFQIYGGVLIGFVVLRLLLIDVWNMELTGRIITFFAVGALLISTAFFGKKRK